MKFRRPLGAILLFICASSALAQAPLLSQILPGLDGLAADTRPAPLASTTDTSRAYRGLLGSSLLTEPVPAALQVLGGVPGIDGLNLSPAVVEQVFLGLDPGLVRALFTSADPRVLMQITAGLQRPLPGLDGATNLPALTLPGLDGLPVDLPASR